jgi:uncharacterized alkaline shock family protein YloU
MSRADGRDRRLACGVSLASLVDQVAEGVPPPDPEHQVGCPHCGAALAELEEIWERVRELAHEEIVGPVTIVQNVIRRIRRSMAPRAPQVPLEVVVPRLVRHALLHGDRGTTRIADVVVAGIAARVARRVPGVHTLVRGRQLDAVRHRHALPTGVHVEVDDRRVALTLALVVEYGASIPAVTREVREAIIESIETATGLDVVGVDVRVNDLHLAGE